VAEWALLPSLWSDMDSNRTRLALGICVAAFGLLYWRVILRLVEDWVNDDNYSHGFFIVPLALYFAWERRGRLANVRVAPASSGLVLVFGGLAMLLAGLLGAELFLTRASMLAVLGGAILFVRGWPTFWVLLFPLAFLVLMIPIPAIVFNQIAFPLQLLASRAGEGVLSALNIPVLREGNVIILANMSLEVAEACSGIRSLISLVTLGIVYAYFTDPRGWMRVAIVGSTIPIAIIANAARVAGTGVAAHYYGEAAAQGFFHTFSGWLVFVVAFAFLFVVTWILRRVSPPPPAARSLAPITA
jgi:exosortase